MSLLQFTYQGNATSRQNEPSFCSNDDAGMCVIVARCRSRIENSSRSLCSQAIYGPVAANAGGMLIKADKMFCLRLELG